MNQVWWHTPIFLVLGRTRQEDCEFKASSGLHNETLSLKKKKKPKIFLRIKLGTGDLLDVFKILYKSLFIYLIFFSFFFF
jgi:hypothetical protein